MSSESHIFSDSDGVVFDFERGFKETFGLDFHSVPAGRAWSLIYKSPDFYEHLPLMPGAYEYWEAIKPHNPTVLTGCPTSGYEEAAEAKRRAWAKFDASALVITCFSRDKQKFMRQPGDLLIDDHEKNLAKWKDAGGRVLLFKDHKQAIADFLAKTWM